MLAQNDLKSSQHEKTFIDSSTEAKNNVATGRGLAGYRSPEEWQIGNLQHLMAGGRRVRSVRSELQDSLNLLAGNPEFLDQFINAHVLQVLEHRGNGSSRTPENPCAAAFTGDALHSRTL
jgi:hypothetical protein